MRATDAARPPAAPPADPLDGARRREHPGNGPRSVHDRGGGRSRGAWARGAMPGGERHCPFCDEPDRSGSVPSRCQLTDPANCPLFHEADTESPGEVLAETDSFEPT